jgi:hypothetical protein
MQGFLCDAPPACSRLDGMRAHQSIEKIPKILLVALAFVFVAGARLIGAYRWQEGTEELRARGWTHRRVPVRQERQQPG